MPDGTFVPIATPIPMFLPSPPLLSQQQVPNQMLSSPQFMGNIVTMQNNQNIINQTGNNNI